MSRSLPEIGAYEVDLPAGWSVDQGIDALARLPGAIGAEPDTRLQASVQPNDPRYDQKQASHLSLFDAEAAWDIQQATRPSPSRCWTRASISATPTSLTPYQVKSLIPKGSTPLADGNTPGWAGRAASTWCRRCGWFRRRSTVE